MKWNIKRGIVLVLTGAMLFTGCSSTSANTTYKKAAKKDTNIEVTSANQTGLTLDSLRKKYGETTADYAKESIYVNRDQTIEYPLEFNPNQKNMKLQDCLTLYQDDQLKFKLNDCSYEYDSETKQLVITPPTFGIAELYAQYGSDIDLSDLKGKYLYDETTKDNWGNLKQLYLVQNCDAKTGETLSKPIIHIVKIKSELKQAPVVTYSANENGEAYISWKPVEGAKEYLLFTVTKTENGIDNYTSVFGRTKETSWTAPNMDGDDGRSYLMNEMFRNFISSEDDKDAGQEDMNGDYFETMQANVGVIAITDEGASPISELYPVSEYAKRLPNCLANNASEQQDANSLFRPSIENLPAEASVTMCDGSTSPRVLDYDFDHTKLDTQSLVKTLDINAYISGTKFYKEYRVVIDDVTSVDSQLEELKKRQEGLKNRAGSVDQDVTVKDEDPQVPETTSTPEESVEPEQTEASEETAAPTTEAPVNGITDLKITANSALSEFVASALLVSSKTIDISDFTESENSDTVVDAVLEAQYQNPLVMGIKEISYEQANHLLHVTYYETTEQLEEKRQAVLNKSKEITNQIIKEGMSELDKEMAINDYLCQHGTYDDAALENAKQYDFKQVDEQYQDSFTPYGILVNGVGVCASYAGSFKVLADQAGLDCIVVTGNLNGNLSHAWNRVKVDNEWRTVDSTNNDNDIIQNALFNVPDNGITGVLTADDRYVMDDKADSYSCKSEEDEYYHHASKFFAKDAIVQQFTDALKKDNQSILRTEYTITDDDFNSIAQSVAQSIQKDLKGYYWLGVIHLTK